MWILTAWLGAISRKEWSKFGNLFKDRHLINHIPHYPFPVYRMGSVHITVMFKMTTLVLNWNFNMTLESAIYMSQQPIPYNVLTYCVKASWKMNNQLYTYFSQIIIES